MSECVLWEGVRDPHGYGRRGKRLAHRIAWESVVGPIPQGFMLHHECENPPCVNVEHLRLMTFGEHTLMHRPASVVYERARSLTHCKRGHEFTSENTYVTSEGKRQCRTCHRDCERRRRARA